MSEAWVSVAPPAENVWEVPAITEDALHRLRLTDQDVDAEQVAAACDEATEVIDQFLDRVETYDTTLVSALHQCAVDLAIDLYRRKDAPFTVAASYSPEEYVTVDRDPLVKVRALLRPYKQRWGVG